MELIRRLALCTVVTEVQFHSGLVKRETQQDLGPQASRQSHTVDSLRLHSCIPLHQLGEACVFLPWWPQPSSRALRCFEQDDGHLAPSGGD